jgi:hypothetical protein
MVAPVLKITTPLWPEPVVHTFVAEEVTVTVPCK